MNMLKDNKAETPIEVMIVVMAMIITMAGLMLTFGNFMDQFMATIAIIQAQLGLSAWGTSMMNSIPVRYAEWFFIVPGFMILLILIWGIKTVIKKHQYSTQEQQFISEEY